MCMYKRERWREEIRGGEDCVQEGLKLILIASFTQP